MSDASLLLTATVLKPTSGHSDGELLATFVTEQSEAAFAELMQRHGAMVFAVARLLLRSPTDAEDVCQATFLLLARKASSLRRERSLAGWLYGVTRRLCADLRKQQKRRTRREELAQQQRETTVTSPPLLRQQEVLLKLDNELGRLSSNLREPLVLHCLEGLSHQEIALRFGVAIGTFASRGSSSTVCVTATPSATSPTTRCCTPWTNGDGSRRLGKHPAGPPARRFTDQRRTPHRQRGLSFRLRGSGGR